MTLEQQITTLTGHRNVLGELNENRRIREMARDENAKADRRLQAWKDRQS